MEPAAVLVWRILDEWTTPGEMDRYLAEAFPEVGDDDRVMARTEIIGVLQDDDLVERR